MPMENITYTRNVIVMNPCVKFNKCKVDIQLVTSYGNYTYLASRSLYYSDYSCNSHWAGLLSRSVSGCTKFSCLGLAVGCTGKACFRLAVHMQ